VHQNFKGFFMDVVYLLLLAVLVGATCGLVIVCERLSRRQS